MKRHLLLPLLFSYLFVRSQTPITAYSIANQPATASSVSAAGWGTIPNYPSSTIFTTLYGQRASGNAVERVVNEIFIGPRKFAKIPQSNGRPFEKVVINRHPASTGSVINASYERTKTSGSTVYFDPSYVDSLENIINSFVCNRGSDNTFANPAGYRYTSANIERVDLLDPSGITVMDLLNYGFLFNDRGGNDGFKVAVVTALDGNGAVSAIGNLVTVPASSWGRVGPSILTTVLSRSMGTDNSLRPRQNLGAQKISGVFLSLADLGLTVGSTFYGLVVFPTDVTASMDLIHLTNVPQNTNGRAGTSGGFDLMAGGGYYTLVTPSSLPVTIFTLSGVAQGRSIALHWETPSAPERKHFELQKWNGSNWVVLEDVSLTGEGPFPYTDSKPVNGKNTYRVKLTEDNGKVLYSNTVVIDFKGPQTLLLYPNPARSNITLTSSNVTSQTDIVIIDAKGRLVKKLVWQAGQTYLPIDVRALPAGTYVVRRISSTNGDETLSFVKQ